MHKMRTALQSLRNIFLSAMAITAALVSTQADGQSYTRVSLSGYNVDMIANGVGSASASTTGGLGSYAFIAEDFRATSGSVAPTYALPATGLVNSTTETGLSFHLAPYAGLNTLRINNQEPTGSLSFATPVAGSKLFVLATSGDGSATVTITVNFTDATSQTFTGISIRDWYDGSTINLATAGVGRVNLTNNAVEGSATNPHFYHIPLTLAAGNYTRQIASITVTKTDATGATAAVLAVTVDTNIPSACVAPAAQPTALTFTTTTTTATGSFTASVPAANKYLVLRTTGSSNPSALPVNGTTYTPGTTLGNARVVSAGPATSFTDAGLTPAATYKYTVYGYNDVSCFDAAYNTTAPLQASATTQQLPPNTVSGDTTWVQAHAGVQLDNYNNFDAPVLFPAGNTSYRKILMVFTLGKYPCPAGTQYCGDWDYTIQNFVMTPTDTFEVGRLITPYANAGAPRTPMNWKERYYFDVTDYYPLLKDNANVRLNYQGYSGGFTADIKFAFIEGTPARNVTGIQKLWNGSFTYGSASNSIETNFPATPVTAPAGTQAAAMKFTITGHGSDASNCAEFCSRYYQVYNGINMLEQKQIWRDDCGKNNIYPQSGTWIYNRANWCPGNLVEPNVHRFGNVTAGTVLNPDVNFQAHSGNGSASYTVASAMFFYGGYNFTHDASLERIISPSNFEGDFRSNPTCDNPVIKVKNTGATTIQSLTITYSISGYPLQTFTATGLSIAPGFEQDITLATMTAMADMPTNSAAQFQANITQVNGVADGYANNNSLTTTFVTAPTWPSSFVVSLRSNNNYTQTSWKLQDMSGNIIAQRTPTAALTFYNDPIGTLANGCYKLTVEDTQCDGLYWWANASSTGLGAFFVRTQDLGTLIPFTNGLPTPFYNGSQISIPNYSQDFGCGFTQYFRVGAPLPLSLLSFSGYADADQYHHLSWKTGGEINTSVFEIETSTDAINFQKIATKPAAGNSSNELKYDHVYKPLLQADNYYYRLKMVDIDGSFKYSNTILIKRLANSYVLAAVAPNPFKEKLAVSITATKPGNVEFALYDMEGRLHLKQAATLLKGQNEINLLNASKLAAGVYILQAVVNGEERMVQKVVKH
ncbi:peptide-N-glycosidase F-related protein [Aridibaculum aurantiacum]|uniref:peptide-N-glycosidase F-related protein n=1 Tax=Aridibaculum aurantiacum TaxID=2810307 RepID=UPI001A9638D7|nr:peptide-N-glycosidase F-related protein [Aridibaculum aurantiacum]